MTRPLKQILYVTAKANGAGVDLNLAGLDPKWNIVISNSAAEALNQFEEKVFDVIVANDHLEDMDGFRLLDTVQQRHPNTHRLILADLSRTKTALRSSAIAHQCLPKPLDVTLLRAALERVFNRNKWLSNPKVRELLGRMTIVPSPPALYLNIVRILRDPNSNMDEISTQAEQDPGMTAKLLQLANSAALGLRQKVVKVEEAIGYLGLEMTRSLVLLAHAFAYCNHNRKAGQNVERLWKHSLQTASFARRLAREENCSPDILDECFLAGLLHDIGELLLMANLPQEYEQVLTQARAKEIPSWQAELDHFGASHAELGAELMAIWNLPSTVVEALALHHHPSKLLSSTFGPLAAVHVADVIEQELSGGAPAQSSLDLHYLADIGVPDRLPAWREACENEITKGGE
ncbi:MAG: HDOD domain-containing protein [Limisphaerales bacterium]